MATPDNPTRTPDGEPDKGQTADSTPKSVKAATQAPGEPGDINPPPEDDLTEWLEDADLDNEQAMPPDLVGADGTANF